MTKPITMLTEAEEATYFAWKKIREYREETNPDDISLWMVEQVVCNAHEYLYEIMDRKMKQDD